MDGAPIRSLCQIAAVSARIPLQNSDGDPGEGAPTVAFQVQLRFEGLIDRLDNLAQRFEQGATTAFGLALACRTQQPQPRAGEFGLESGTEIVLVRDQGLSRPLRGQDRVGVEDAQKYLSFVGLRAGQREPHRQPAEGGDQVQP